MTMIPRSTDGQTDGRTTCQCLGNTALCVASRGKKERKNRRPTATTSRMRRHVLFEPIDPQICTLDGVADVINCAKFFENRPKSF